LAIFPLSPSGWPLVLSATTILDLAAWLWGSGLLLAQMSARSIKADVAALAAQLSLFSHAMNWLETRLASCTGTASVSAKASFEPFIPRLRPQARIQTNGSLLRGISPHGLQRMGNGKTYRCASRKNLILLLTFHFALWVIGMQWC
jgi:hypothetical protein